MLNKISSERKDYFLAVLSPLNIRSEQRTNWTELSNDESDNHCVQWQKTI